MLTAVTHQRQQLFVEPQYAQTAFEDIAFYGNKFQAVILAGVVMPDHIHWVICPSAANFEQFAAGQRQTKGKYAGTPERFYLSKIMEDYKRHTAYTINKKRNTPGVKVWQDGFRDDALRMPEAIKRAVWYVVYNPVKAGLVEKPEDYLYLVWNFEG